MVLSPKGEHRRAEIPACRNTVKAGEPVLTKDGLNILLLLFPNQEAFSRSVFVVRFWDREWAGRPRGGVQGEVRGE